MHTYTNHAKIMTKSQIVRETVNEVIIDLKASPPLALDAQNGVVWQETPLTGCLSVYLTCRHCGEPCDEDTVRFALRQHQRGCCSLKCLQDERAEFLAAYKAKWGRDYVNLSK